jgi:transposase
MLPEQPRPQVYLALGDTDMRKGINGLSILVADQLALDPFSGSLFVFCNRQRSLIKILYWHGNGFCLWQKRLERERFQWPKSAAEVMRIEQRALNWLLDGLAIQQQMAHKQLDYSGVL